MGKQNKVAVNLAQNFTDAEKAQARNNIGAASSANLASLSESIQSLEHGLAPLTKFEFIYTDSTLDDVQALVDEGIYPILNINGAFFFPAATFTSSASAYTFAMSVDGRISTMTLNSNGWTSSQKDIPDELPSGGSEGQVLTLDSNGDPEWADVNHPKRIYWAYETQPRQFSLDSQADWLQLSEDGASITFETAGTYLVTGLIGLVNNGSQSLTTGDIYFKFVSDGGTLQDAATVICPISTRYYSNGSVQGMATSRFVVNTPMTITFKWWFKIPSQLMYNFVCNSLVSGSSESSMPNNWIDSLTQYKSHGGRMAFYVEKV